MKTVAMSDHQLKMWRRMIELIGEYKKDKIEFSTLVGELEGAMDVCEFQDQVFVEQWYDLWQNLEIRNAMENGRVDKAKATDEVEALKRFLEAQL